MTAAPVEPPPPPTPHHTEAAWRRWHEARIRALTAPDGWLTLTGLHFLEDGHWSVGSDPANPIHLPSASAPRLGVFEVEGDRVRFTVDRTSPATAAITIDGELVDAADLRADDAGGPSFVRDGERSLALIRRNGRLALRIRDNASPLRTTFDSIPLYPFAPQWILRGRALTAPPGTTVAITNVTGFVEMQPLAATIEVDLPTPNGPLRQHLAATAGSAQGSLFLVFADATSGRGSYPGGRFLTIDAPDPDQQVWLDFNRAHNPVCALSPFATCPTPPASNRIAVAIEAGERYPHRSKEPS